MRKKIEISISSNASSKTHMDAASATTARILYERLADPNERNETAKLIAKVTSGTTDETRAIVQTGCMDRLIEWFGIGDSDYDISVMFAIGNVAGEMTTDSSGSDMREWVLSNSKIILENGNVEENDRVLFNLTIGDNVASEHLLQQVARALVSCPRPSEYIFNGVLNALHRYESVDTILEAFIPQVVESAANRENIMKIRKLAFAIIGKIAATDNADTQVALLFKCGCMPMCMQVEDEELQATALWILGNLFIEKDGRDIFFKQCDLDVIFLWLRKCKEEQTAIWAIRFIEVFINSTCHDLNYIKTVLIGRYHCVTELFYACAKWHGENEEVVSSALSQLLRIVMDEDVLEMLKDEDWGDIDTPQAEMIKVGLLGYMPHCGDSDEGG